MSKGAYLAFFFLLAILPRVENLSQEFPKERNLQSPIITILPNPPQGGTVEVTNASGFLRITMKAANGWYLSNLLLAGGIDYARYPQTSFDSQKENFAANDDATAFIFYEGFFSATNNATVTVSFESAAPRFLDFPANHSVLGGRDVMLSASAIGEQPISYQWLKDGQFLPGKTSTNLFIPNALPFDAGTYSLVASNAFGVTNSAPTLLSVKDFLVLAEGKPVENAKVTLVSPASILIESLFPNGRIFYTLDGSTPDFTSLPLNSPVLQLSASTFVRLIAYSSDLSQSVTDSVEVTVVKGYGIDRTVFGGQLILEPDSFRYAAGTTVTLKVLPLPGFTFMGWEGALSGNQGTNSITMDGDKVVVAICGKALPTTITGNGRIQMTPSAPIYPDGSVIRIEAVPDPGFYFGLWGGSQNGSANPLKVTMSLVSEPISALFAPLPTGQVALTLLSEGAGTISNSVQANKYAIGDTTTLTAIPNLDQEFLGWSGDAEGTANSLTVVMDKSKVIRARFSQTPILRLRTFDPKLFIFEISGAPGARYSLERSINLSSWEAVMTKTNFLGVITHSFPRSGTPPAEVFRAVAR